MKYHKIWILGGGGSGKTTFAKRLAEKSKLPLYHLDHTAYSKNFKIKYNEKRRDNKLKEISNKKRWIIEGANSSEWVLRGIEKAELIIALEVGTLKRFFRTIKRHVLEKKWGEKDSLLQLLYWVVIYPFKGKRRHKKMIERCHADLVVLKNNNQINKFLKKI